MVAVTRKTGKRKVTGRYRFDRDGIRQVGQLLKACREEKGWSLAELQEQSGISASTASDLENGNVNSVQADTLESLRYTLQPINSETGKVYTLGELFAIMLIREPASNGNR